MSVFTSRVTKTLDIPHDPGQSAVIRKLAPRHLDAASKEAQRQAIAEVKEIGVDLLKQLRTLKPEEVAAATDADPLLTYDTETLIRKGLVSWTYDADINEATVADLDDETQDFLAREVLKLSRPGLFTSDAEKAADEKND